MNCRLRAPSQNATKKPNSSYPRPKRLTSTLVDGYKLYGRSDGLILSSAIRQFINCPAEQRVFESTPSVSLAMARVARGTFIMKCLFPRRKYLRRAL